MGNRRIGIMGGTFDPIHVGHLILGEAAYGQFSLDRVLFLPSGNPPHKPDRAGGATLSQRVRMVELAIADNPHFALSLAEARREGACYTKETLARLHGEYPGTEFFFIMGADSLLSFETWKDPGEIARLATLVVAKRDHVGERRLEREMERLRAAYGAKAEKLSVPRMDISSRALRAFAAEGRSLKYFLSQPVLEYLREHRLYGSGG